MRPVSGFMFTLMPSQVLIGNAKVFVSSRFSPEYNQPRSSRYAPIIAPKSLGSESPARSSSGQTDAFRCAYESSLARSLQVVEVDRFWRERVGNVQRQGGAQSTPASASRARKGSISFS